MITLLKDREAPKRWNSVSHKAAFIHLTSALIVRLISSSVLLGRQAVCLVRPLLQTHCLSSVASTVASRLNIKAVHVSNSYVYIHVRRSKHCIWYINQFTPLNSASLSICNLQVIQCYSKYTDWWLHCATNNYKHAYTLQSYYSEGQVKCTSSNLLTLRHLNEEMCVCRWREMEDMRTLFTHSTLLSHIGILALWCRLQLSMTNLLQTREGL